MDDIRACLAYAAKRLPPSGQTPFVLCPSNQSPSHLWHEGLFKIRTWTGLSLHIQAFSSWFFTFFTREFGSFACKRELTWGAR